ncbi:hypothetical protein [Caloranaerobacter azorensis]|uniref:Uncharacterized protein n=1 Tax=Caloranaerobacter azorensis TaxID=116090 RepID=A0A6P1YJF4_9FIRM|nr:hypothetical protein [Caloranaerobacter azorensis]QIB27926.1 hypothetical protein G3A45_11995 [Caloranaerobacter azorensis]
MLDRIIDEIKEKSVVIYTIILLSFTCFLLVKFWNLVVLTREALFKSVIILALHWESILFIIVLFITVRYLFKLSNEKSQEEIDRYHKPLEVESKCRRYISAKLIERYGKLNNVYGKILEIVIRNESHSDINYVKGYISLYKDFTRISKIDFEIDNFRKLFSERVFYDFIDHKKLFWDGFDIYVYQIRIGDKIDNNFTIEGNHFIRTHYLELNLEKFYDFRIFGVKTKYNLAWLKKKVREKILYGIQFFYSERRIHFYQKSFLLKLIDIDIISRYLRFLLVIFVLFIILLAIVFLLTDIGKVLLALYEVWKYYFQQIANFI